MNPHPKYQVLIARLLDATWLRFTRWFADFAEQLDGGYISLWVYNRLNGCQDDWK